MAAKRSDRNKKKQEKIKTSQIGSSRKLSDMPIQERKQNIQQNGEAIKQKVTLMIESLKDNTKGLFGLYIKELLTQEDKIESLTVENKKLKTLLTKHKIKF